ncbi:MAG: glycoside hydrolase family 3 C-terminal domain-containing protein [Bacteroidales bacterium]|nr:glycoside hydrolase family 3 C-terminal domain-containing protein [Bacteroidales bacterium]
MKRICSLLLAALCAQVFIPAGAQSRPAVTDSKVEDVVKAMTLHEKATLLVGVYSYGRNPDGTTRKAVPGAAGGSAEISRLGIPYAYYTDGPQGVRINPTRKGTDKTFYCTAFPIATMMASTWNTDIVREVGEAMGNEVLEYGNDILLAPAINIHRNPLCGRNFEYYSEDPFLAGKVAAAAIQGVQSQGVGTSLKHFAVNSQETFRRENDARVSQRAVREIYLKGFEIAVKEARPWTIMSAYNQINGVTASEHHALLTEVLRDEWGFDGFVMTDWTDFPRNTAAQIKAGNEQLMPGLEVQVEQIEEAVKNGTLTMADVDLAVTRMLRILFRTPTFKGYKYSNAPDLAAHAKLVRRAADEGAVLLKNEGGVLPLRDKNAKVALFGFGSYKIYQGGTGSGNVHTTGIVNVYDALVEEGFRVHEDLAAVYDGVKIDFKIGEKLAKLRAADCDIAIFTIRRSAGEFVDRREIKGDFYLTDNERASLTNVSEAFHKAGKKVIVLLNTGGVIETVSWKDMADAILLPWQPGVEAGHTVVDILTGRCNPSGRLPMTWPVAYNDIPSSKNFPSNFEGNSWKKGPVRDSFDPNKRNEGFTEYEEGIWVGYRHFATFGVPVSFPFGYGLSYTTFSYSDPVVKAGKKGAFTASVTVTNTGSVPGKEVVQLYVSAPKGTMEKPLRELKGFAKTRELAPGESQTVTISFDTYGLASFDEALNAWVTDAGQYTAQFAASVEDIRQSASFKVRKASVVKLSAKL